MAEHAVAAVVPVLDEADAIAAVVQGLLANGACCVLCVDGGSRDGTPDVVRRAGGQLIADDPRGYGQACLTGAEVARAEPAHRIICFLDGDGSCDPADLPSLVEALADADVALGRRDRHLVQAGALPWHAAFGNDLVGLLLRWRTGRRPGDLPPFKAIRADALDALRLDERGFGWTVQFVARSLSRPGLRVVERPVRFLVRQGGRSKVSGSLRASAAAGLAMLRTAVRETRRRPLLALLAKAPGMRTAKTRLAADLGAQATDRLWSACLRDTARELERAAATLGLDCCVVVPDASHVPAVTALVGPRWRPCLQTRPGLAGVLADVLSGVFSARAPFAIAVAGDNPGLPGERIAEAVTVLRRYDAVLGPCPDGGYFLVGLRAGRSWRALPIGASFADRIRGVFGEVALGTDSAFERTRRGFRSMGFRVGVVSAWADVDVVADLGPLSTALAADVDRAPDTWAWLQRNGLADVRAPSESRA